MHNVHLFDTTFGTMALIWSDLNSITINSIIIPTESYTVDQAVEHEYQHFSIKSCSEIDNFAKKITDFCEGKHIIFDQSLLSMENLTPFRVKVYETLTNIPYGSTISYGELAALAGFYGASRAVGTAMKKNPFPFIIPCHRVICADGSIGGFFGNIQMKKDLLKLESNALSCRA